MKAVMFVFIFIPAYYNDIIVGAVCCRIDIIDGQRRLYIMTLGCLAPYRARGIGTKMLEHVLNFVEKDGNFDSIFLYVTTHPFLPRFRCHRITENVCHTCHPTGTCK